MSDHSNIPNGCVDLHYHSGPSPFPRLLNVVEAAEMYSSAGFRAVIMKSHHHSTVMEILALQKYLDSLPVKVYGGIALNGAVGGLNPRAVELALRMGGKVVWFPTMSSQAHISYHEVHHDSPFPTSSVPLTPEEVISVTDENGKVKREVYEIVEIIRDTGAILSMGHMGLDQVEAVLGVAQSVGVERIILSHPDFVQQLSEEDTVSLARRGVTIEHCIGMYNDQSSRKDVWPIGRLIRWIEAVGPERTILGSDVGQRTAARGDDTYQRVLELLAINGVSDAVIETICVKNGTALLGL
jgi:hypothetical protein